MDDGAEGDIGVGGIDCGAWGDGDCCWDIFDAGLPIKEKEWMVVHIFVWFGVWSSGFGGELFLKRTGQSRHWPIRFLQSVQFYHKTHSVSSHLLKDFHHTLKK